MVHTRNIMKMIENSKIEMTKKFKIGDVLACYNTFLVLGSLKMKMVFSLVKRDMLKTNMLKKLDIYEI